MLVVAQHGQGRAEEGSAGKIPVVPAAQVRLVELSKAVIGLMRVDQQHRLAAAGLATRDRPGIAAGSCLDLSLQLLLFEADRNLVAGDVHMASHQLQGGRSSEREQIPRLES